MNKDVNMLIGLYESMTNDNSLFAKLKPLIPKFIEDVQKVLDGWEQDENGEDAELGYGGICQDVAEAIASVCNDNGVSCITVSAEMGEQHVWAIAYDEETEESYEIDISPYTYETGGGYTWKKIHGVQIKPEDIHIAYVMYDDFKGNLEDF
jgi:hypothetical protein